MRMVTSGLSCDKLPARSASRYWMTQEPSGKAVKGISVRVAA